MKIIQKDMHVNTIKHILRNKLQVEKYIYLKNCHLDKFSKCWDKWIYIFSYCFFKVTYIGYLKSF